MNTTLTARLASWKGVSWQIIGPGQPKIEVLSPNRSL